MSRHVMEPWATKAQLDTLMQPLGEFGFAVKDVDDDASTVTLKWQDPADARVGTREGGYFVFSKWARTVIVKKLGADPDNAEDGTAVVTSTVRDAYKTSGYVDTQADGGDWHYAAFAFAENGLVTRSIFSENYLFGYYVDENDADEATCVHYLGANEGYEPMSMDFINDVFDYGSWAQSWILPRPCMLKSNGTVDYYLNPDNYLQKEDGTTSDVANADYDGNAMLEFPAIFVKVAYDADLKRIYFYFSNRRLDDTYECWSCKKSDGTYAEHFYLPCYEGSVIGGKMRSLSTGAIPTSNTNQTPELSAARQNGAGWNPTLWADEMLLRELFPLVFRRLNSQAALGSAFVSGASSLQIQCGSLNTRGLFYGSPFDGATANRTGCKFFGMEQPWGHRWRRCVGMNLIDGQYYAKMTQSTADGSSAADFVTSGTAADYTSGYIATGVAVPTNWNRAYIKRFTHDSLVALMPEDATGGSSTTYACDTTWSSSGVRCFASGGVCSYGADAGAFASSLDTAPSDPFWTFGASLSYHHL